MRWTSRAASSHWCLGKRPQPSHPADNSKYGTKKRWAGDLSPALIYLKVTFAFTCYLRHFAIRKRGRWQVQLKEGTTTGQSVTPSARSWGIFWKLEDCGLGQTTFYYFPDCTAHKNRMQGNDFVQCVMHGHGIMCSGVTMRTARRTGRSCWRQGTSYAWNVMVQHRPAARTRRRWKGIHTIEWAVRESECVTCHMPKIETEGVPGSYVHAHTFRFIAPAMTDQFKIPNPCTTCHVEKSTAWAEEAISHWHRAVGVEDSIDALQTHSSRHAELLCNCGRSFIATQAVGMFVSVSHYDELIGCCLRHQLFQARFDCRGRSYYGGAQFGLDRGPFKVIP